MIILPNSDIQSGNNRVYLNNREQRTNLFFTSAKKVQYYFLMRDGEVISNGILQGFNMNGVFNYRFDFLHFIKIFNQREITKTSVDSYGSFSFVGNNTCNLYMYIGDGDILQANILAGKLTVESDGRVYLNKAFYNYNNLLRDYNLFVTFSDTASTEYDDELQYRRETQPLAVAGRFIPITIYRNNSFQYEFKNGAVSVYESPILKKGSDSTQPGAYDGYILTQSDGYIWTENQGKIILEQGMDATESSKTGYITYMIYVPNNITEVIFSVTYADDVDRTVNINYPVLKECLEPYYFWNQNGSFDSIYCSGVVNKVIEVEKEYITLNGSQIPHKIISIEKFRHNTGFKLLQEQMYSLINSPLVYKLEDKIRTYNIDLESFTGYNGVNISDRNIELIFTKPKEIRRITNRLLNFFD